MDSDTMILRTGESDDMLESVKSKKSCTGAIVYSVASLICNAFRSCFGIYCLSTQFVAVFIHFTILLLFSPFYLIYPRLFNYIERVGYDWLATTIVSFAHFSGYRLEACGELEKLKEIINVRKDKAIVILNHQSPADILFTMWFWLGMSPESEPNWSGKNGYRGVSWIMDYAIKFSHLGMVSTMHKDFFVLQSSDLGCCMKTCRKIRTKDQLREVEQQRLTKHISQVFKFHRFVSLFPEGGLFYNRKESSARFAQKANLEPFSHVAIPRMGALETIVHTIRDCQSKIQDDPNADHLMKPDFEWSDDIRYLIDLTMVYPSQTTPVSLTETLLTPHMQTHQERYREKRRDGKARVAKTVFMNCKIHSFDDIPKIEDTSNVKPEDALSYPFEKYFVDMFREKDTFMKKMYKSPTREMPEFEANTPISNFNQVDMSRTKMVFMHIFYWSCMVGLVFLILAIVWHVASD